MHSSVIGKIEKAHRYARELDRISFERLAVTVRGDNDTHRVTLDADGWLCTCHYFEMSRACAHVLAIQQVLGIMLPEDAQTSLFEPASDALAGSASA